MIIFVLEERKKELRTPFKKNVEKKRRTIIFQEQQTNKKTLQNTYFFLSFFVKLWVTLKN